MSSERRADWCTMKPCLNSNLLVGGVRRDIAARRFLFDAGLTGQQTSRDVGHLLATCAEQSPPTIAAIATLLPPAERRCPPGRLSTSSLTRARRPNQIHRRWGRRPGRCLRLSLEIACHPSKHRPQRRAPAAAPPETDWILLLPPPTTMLSCGNWRRFFPEHLGSWSSRHMSSQTWLPGGRSPATIVDAISVTTTERVS